MQGTAGNVIPPPGFLPAIQSIAREHGALLIADEMITGFGRTGKMWGVDHDGVVPDILTVGKGVGGGLSALRRSSRPDELTSHPPFSNPSGSSSSYGGNPLAVGGGARVARDHHAREPRRPTPSGSAGAMLDRLLAMKEKHRVIGDVRGKGLLLGLELVKDRATKELVSKGRDEGPLPGVSPPRPRRDVLHARSSASTRRSNIDEATALEGLELLDEAIGAVSSRRRAG